MRKYPDAFILFEFEEFFSDYGQIKYIGDDYAELDIIKGKDKFSVSSIIFGDNIVMGWLGIHLPSNYETPISCSSDAGIADDRLLNYVTQAAAS
jgi:hypothetical protein